MPKKSIVNYSHYRPMSFNMGDLVPIGCYDVVPGDVIDHDIGAFVRCMPLATPPMSGVDIDTFAFFVPDRLVYDDSEDFHTGGDDGLAEPISPYMVVPEGGFAPGSLPDFYEVATNYQDENGDPVVNGVGLEFDAKPLRGRNLIWNTYFRDSQLQPELAISTLGGEGGPDIITDISMVKANFKRDYFTTCRPSAQLGPDVYLPLTGDAPVVGLGKSNNVFNVGPINAIESTGDTETYTSAQYIDGLSGNGAFLVEKSPDGDYPNIRADLSNVTSFDIRDLREASAVQRFLEFNNIFGGRYWEQVRARFGAPVLDNRLQLPEFLGSGSAHMQFSEVLSTAADAPGSTEGVGDMAGHGMSVLRANRFRRAVPEHGYVHIFMVVRPKALYMQGMPRHLTRKTRFDYLLPEFQHLGDQVVRNKEVFANHPDPEGAFGFNPMFEEYRTKYSSVHGHFRTNLNDWHWGRIFATPPALNGTFVTCNATDRPFQAKESISDTMLAQIRHKLFIKRSVAKRGPGRLL